jgi:hypothetical protein
VVKAKLVTRAATAFACTAALIATAGSAQADDNSYMNYLSTHGVPPWPAGPGLKAGHDACNALRDGSTPQSFIGTMGLMGTMYGQTVVDGAHQFLCPGA